MLGDTGFDALRFFHDVIRPMRPDFMLDVIEFNRNGFCGGLFNEFVSESMSTAANEFVQVSSSMAFIGKTGSLSLADRLNKIRWFSEKCYRNIQIYTYVYIRNNPYHMLSSGFDALQKF